MKNKKMKEGAKTTIFQTMQCITDDFILDQKQAVVSLYRNLIVSR